jgi:beta-glucosidase
VAAFARFAALGDSDLVQRYADVARQEYLAAGIRVALHPQIDLATEPRWARIGMTFGEDADLTSRLVTAYIRGFQGTQLGPASVATMTKHFPGGGPQQDGEDPHFAYGREQVYPGAQSDYHLKPFRAAIAAGMSQMMLTTACRSAPIGKRSVSPSATE